MKTDPVDLIVVTIPANALFKPIGVHAMDMSNWLKDHGLVWGKDYDWYIDRNRNETRFRFHNSATMSASLFSLRWVINDIQQ